MSAVVCRMKLPQRVPYGYVAAQHPFLCMLIHYRLHGTWLPPALTRQQRPLPEPLAEQALLQDKLSLSRLKYFASVIFHRPTHREKSACERVFLAFFLPTSVGALALAAIEVISSRIRDRADLGYNRSFSNSSYPPLDQDKSRISTFPWAQVSD